LLLCTVVDRVGSVVIGDKAGVSVALNGAGDALLDQIWGFRWLFGAVGGVFRAGGANRGTDTTCGPADRRRGWSSQIEGQTRYLAGLIAAGAPA